MRPAWINAVLFALLALALPVCARQAGLLVPAYHLADEAAMQAVLERALPAGVGWVYLTDDTLPAFWEAQVQALVRFNQLPGEQTLTPEH